MLRGTWNKKRKYNNENLILELKEENNFLYELLADGNLDIYDTKLKISRMNFINIMQKILYQKQIEEQNKYLDKDICYLINLESETKKLIDEYKKQSEMSLRFIKNEISYEIVLLEAKKNTIHKQIDELSEKVKEKKKQVIELNDEILYQSFGLYTPVYNLMNSSMYKKRIELCRADQKEMLRNKTAAFCYTNWAVNDSIREGKKWTNKNIQQILRCFNNECDYLISKVKYNNIDAVKKKINKSFSDLNKLNDMNNIQISERYLNLKIDELQLCYEYEQRKQEEKEYARSLKEEEREQAKLLKEIEEERKKIKKEQDHYNTYLKHINEQIEIENDPKRLEFLIEKRDSAKQNLIDLDVALKDIDYREANQKAGYVYIASNIGAFGENVYKIGMTRRLNPQDRIDELGGASVPFKFDVHAMIFSDNAPALEAALHRAFDDRKVNMTNNRKEFFNVTLDEIKQVILENYDKTVDFVDIPSAQQYRESLKIKENISRKKTP